MSRTCPASHLRCRTLCAQPPHRPTAESGIRDYPAHWAGTKVSTPAVWPIEPAVGDSFEPLLPPDITLDQVVKFAEALAKAQPKRMKIATTAAEVALREIIES